MRPGISETGQMFHQRSGLPSSARFSRSIAFLMKRWVLVLISIAVPCALAGFFVGSHAASPHGFSRVSEGMTRAEVEGLLGAADLVREREAGGITLMYGGLFPPRWCTMQVEFDADGRVTSKFHDH